MRSRQRRVYTGVELSPELHAGLKAMARADDRSMTGLLRVLIRDEMARRGLPLAASAEREPPRRVAAAR